MKEALYVGLIKGYPRYSGGEIPKVKVSDEESHSDYVGLEIDREDGKDLVVWNRGNKAILWQSIETDAEVASLSYDEKGILTHATQIGGSYLRIGGKTPPILEHL